jgi:YhcN/YlaJ family sporulation lipoprotein
MNNPNMPRTINPGTDMDDSNRGIIVMVGLSLNKNVDTADKTNEIKRTVVNRLRANDRRISQVLVTTDPNLITRINDVANGIIQGRPIQTFERDINDIGRELQMQQPAF